MLSLDEKSHYHNIVIASLQLLITARGGGELQIFSLDHYERAPEDEHVEKKRM